MVIINTLKIDQLFLLKNGEQIIAFPGTTLYQLENKLSHIKERITLSIIGCVVNGPGEAALTDVGITGGKKGNNMLYLSGIQKEKVLTLLIQIKIHR